LLLLLLLLLVFLQREPRPEPHWESKAIVQHGMLQLVIAWLPLKLSWLLAAVCCSSNFNYNSNSNSGNQLQMINHLIAQRAHKMEIERGQDMTRGCSCCSCCASCCCCQYCCSCCCYCCCCWVIGQEGWPPA